MTRDIADIQEAIDLEAPHDHACAVPCISALMKEVYLHRLFQGILPLFAKALQSQYA